MQLDREQELRQLWERTLSRPLMHEQFGLWAALHTGEVVRLGILRTARKNVELGGTLTQEHRVAMRSRDSHYDRQIPKFPTPEPVTTMVPLGISAVENDETSEAFETSPDDPTALDLSPVAIVAGEDLEVEDEVYPVDGESEPVPTDGPDE